MNTPVSGGWSAQTRLLPMLEQSNLFNAINFAFIYDAPANLTVTATTVDVFVCPSEVNSTTFDASKVYWGVPTGATVNYVVASGDWYVWGGFGLNPSRATFSPNQSRRMSEISDGLSTTMFMSEVKSLQFQITECGGQLVRLNPTEVPGTDVPSDRRVIVRDESACATSWYGHAFWTTGGVDQTGFTTAERPNFVLNTSLAKNQNSDVIGVREMLGGPAYAAVTARSYHPGGVNTLMGDGSVRFVSDNVNYALWRALGTRGSGEVVDQGGY